MLSLIVAYDQNGGIGKGNQMPWHYPEDLKYFKKVTKNHTVAMGRNTFLSIGRPLPYRENIVFTASPQTLNTFEGIQIETDPLKFFEANEKTEEEIFIIGGSMIYQLALPFVKRLYITHIDGTYDVDTYFPKVDFQHYKMISQKKNGKLTFAIYEKE